MPRNGSGTYQKVFTFVTNTVISSTDMNAQFDDVATALTGSIAADGQTQITADLSLNSHQITTLAAGVAATSAATVQQALGSVEPRVSSTPIVKADANKTITTSTAITLAFDTPANLGANFKVRIANVDTSYGIVVTLSGSDATRLYCGEIRDFVSDGTSVTSTMVKGGRMRFIASTVLIEQPGWEWIFARVTGAGGGGGSGNTTVSGGSGGGGAVREGFLRPQGPATPWGVTVGAPGLGAVGAANPTAGGYSSFMANTVELGIVASGGGAAAARAIGAGAGGTCDLTIWNNTNASGATHGDGFLAICTTGVTFLGKGGTAQAMNVAGYGAGGGPTTPGGARSEWGGAGGAAGRTTAGVGEFGSDGQQGCGSGGSGGHGNNAGGSGGYGGKTFNIGGVRSGGPGSIISNPGGTAGGGNAPAGSMQYCGAGGGGGNAAGVGGRGGDGSIGGGGGGGGQGSTAGGDGGNGGVGETDVAWG